MAATMPVHLDRWASTKAPLNEEQKASISMLSDFISTSAAAPYASSSTASYVASGDALPNGARADVASTSRITTNLELTRVDTVSSSNTADQKDSNRLPTVPLSDAPSYLSWFEKQQAQIISSTESAHIKQLQSMTEAADEADGLLDQLEAARIHIAELRAGAKYVQEGSEGLREEAESMVERIDHLSQLAEALAVRLSYFAILPASTSFLSSPSLSLVLSPDFLFTIDRLDVALAFVGAHPHYRDAALYKMRFEHCVVRAGTLIRMYTVGRWKELAYEVSNKLKEWAKARQARGKEKDETSEDDRVLMTFAEPIIYSLLWDRYEEEFPQLRPLIFEMEKRSSPDGAPASTDLTSADDLAAEKDKREAEPPMDEESLLADYSAIKDSPEDQVEESRQGAEEGTEVFRSPEFASLLTECRTAYFDARRSLLLGMASDCVSRLEISAQSQGAAAPSVASLSATTSSTKSTAAVSMVKRGLSFCRALCETETSLYARFFALSGPGSSSKDLQVYFEQLCAPFHDRIRPRLAKETGLTALAELSLALLEGGEALATPSDPVFGPIASTLLADVQSRLITRARSTALGTEIGSYSVKESDLDYPAKLSTRAHKRAQSSIGGAGLLEAAAAATDAGVPGFRRFDAGQTPASQIGAGSTVRLFASPPSSIVSTWYAPLAQTLSLLSTLNEAVTTNSFVQIATTVIEACRSSIVSAAEMMKSGGAGGQSGGFAGARIGVSGRMDPPLFALRHLFLLAEMAASVQLRATRSGDTLADRRAQAMGVASAGLDTSSSTSRAVDFAMVVDALNSLWTSTSSVVFAPRSLIGLSKGAESTTTAGEDLDQRSGKDGLLKSDGKGSEEKREETQLQKDIQRASDEFVDVVAQGVVLPLRVYMDQSSRRDGPRASISKASGSASTSQGANAPQIDPLSPSSPANPLKSPPMPSSSGSATSSPVSSKVINRARAAYEAFETCAHNNITEAVSALKLYLEDNRAIRSLAEPVVDKIIDVYSIYCDNIRTTLDDAHLPWLSDVQEIRTKISALLLES